MRKVLIFGVFDGIHEGHRQFLKQASEHGDFLIAAVTRDEVAVELKGKNPQRSLEVRMRELEATGLVDEVVAGDSVLGRWKVIETCRPDSVALGYDQEELGDALRTYVRERGLDITITVVKSHEPEKYHSSILNDSHT